MTHATGLFASLKTLVSTLLDMGQTRLALLADELEEDRLRMARLLFLGLFMSFFFCLSMVFFTLLVVAIFWDTYRLLTIGMIATIYLVVAGGLAIHVMREFKHKPKLFSSSLAELIKDRAALESD